MNTEKKMYKIDLKDETFNLNDASVYKLLMQFYANDFSFSVYDTQRNKFVALCSIELENHQKTPLEILSKIFENDEIFQVNYKSTKAILATKKSIFVPKPLFDKEKIDKLLNFNIKIEKSEQILFDELKNDIFNIYAIDKQIFQLFETKFSRLKYFNQASVLLSSNISKKSINKKRIFIESGKYFFDLILIENNKIVYRNVFDYQDDKDFVFYILSVLDKYDFDNENDEINISGVITTKSGAIELLRQYVKRIRFRRTEHNFSYVFNEIEINIYTNLLNLVNCE